MAKFEYGWLPVNEKLSAKVVNVGIVSSKTKKTQQLCIDVSVNDEMFTMSAVITSQSGTSLLSNCKRFFVQPICANAHVAFKSEAKTTEAFAKALETALKGKSFNVLALDAPYFDADENLHDGIQYHFRAIDAKLKMLGMADSGESEVGCVLK